MNLKLSYFNFVCNVLFFLLGCTVSSLVFLLDSGPSVRERSGGSSAVHRPRVDMVILIMSGPGNGVKREAVRNSWLTAVPSSDSTVHFFTVGEEGLTASQRGDLVSEHAGHGDLLLLPLVDSYRNLTLKLALSLQALTHLYAYNYLLKLDDDSFLHYERLQEEVKKVGSDTLYWGYFSPSAHVFRSGPWREAGWNLCDRYLPYALGGGYVLAYTLTSFIADNLHRFKLYSNEDVSVGVWLSAVAAHRVHDLRFDTQLKSRGCWNDQIVKHKVGGSEMKILSERLRSGLDLCDREFGTDLRPYSYDWARKPSQCCQPVDPTNSSVPRIYPNKPSR